MYQPSLRRRRRGSGSAVIASLEESFKTMLNFGGFGNLDARAVIISDILKENAEALGITSVGGLFQIAVITPQGSYFLPYKSRSVENTDPLVLDIEMAIENDRWVQRNLKTGKEIPLLLPTEILPIDANQDLFAILNEEES